jgi:cation diffusion facilitator CzcD-associated flavoprotein CzcO
MTTVVVGAGPYGLSIAAHLQAWGAPVRIFSDVMASWRNMMPAGMCLKSAPWASSLGAPRPGLTLSDFESATGVPQLREDQVVPVEQFIRYGEWFAGQLSPGVETGIVRQIDQRGGGYLVSLDSGEVIEARSVVLANGLAGFAHVPAKLAALTSGAPVSGRVSVAQLAASPNGEPRRPRSRGEHRGCGDSCTGGGRRAHFMS